MTEDLKTKAEKLVEIGRKFVERCKEKWKNDFDLPFNFLIYALLSSTGLRDEAVMKMFREIKRKAGGKRKIPGYLASLDDNDLERIAQEIGFSSDKFRDGVKGILELDEDVNLRRDDLSHVKDLDKFYDALRKIPRFGGKEIGPWVECELVRTWNLEPSEKLRLPEKTIECLKLLGLDLKFFKTEDYPYVDVFFEYRVNKGPLRRLRDQPSIFKREAERLLKAKVDALSFDCGDPIDC